MEPSTISPRKTPRATATSRPRIRKLDGERAPDGNRQLFRAFYVYDLPFFQNASGLLRTVAAGWQLSGSTSITSGDYLNVTLGTD